MPLPSIALIDDSQGVALASADWAKLDGRTTITVLREPFANEDAAAEALAPFDILVPMRERTAFPASLVRRLPNLKLFAMTGPRSGTFDIPAFTAQGVLVCNTGSTYSGTATAELAFGLLLAVTRNIHQADAAIRGGHWHEGVALGGILEGKRLGVVGLGKIGNRTARFGQAFGMDVVAWSENLTPETAAGSGALRVEKDELFRTSDVVSLHLVLSDRTRGVVGAPELQSMKDGAIIINTARGPLIDEAALLKELSTGRIGAGLDVFDKEPLPADHPIRDMRNTVLTPHLGYSAKPAIAEFYGSTLENIVAWLDGKPIRVVNPEAVKPPG